MTAREEILHSIRRLRLEPQPLPELAGAWIQYPDPVEQFSVMLQSVGGRAIPVARCGDLTACLEKLSVHAAAQRICSLVNGIDSRGVDLPSIDDPHELADVDLAIVPGEFGVAENGAIWVAGANDKHRAVYFLAQHLVVVLPVRDMVHNMHAAYERLGGAPFRQPGFGMFLSGPSKTADIEQSLVIGAHGARSMTVFLVGGEDLHSAATNEA